MDRKPFYQKLEVIYIISKKQDEEPELWRHLYSDIFSTLTLIDGGDSKSGIDVLVQNLGELVSDYTPPVDKKDDIFRSLLKLYDHVNLDVARINYSKGVASETQSKLNEVTLLADNTKKDVEVHFNDIQKKTDSFTKEITESSKKNKRENITILGIFASIVLAFTGGLVFSSSVLDNIDKVSIYRLLIVVTLIGGVLFNLIWVLLEFIRTINGKPIARSYICIVFNICAVLVVILSVTTHPPKGRKLLEAAQELFLLHR